MTVYDTGKDTAMSCNDALDKLTKEELIDLIEIYSKNWIAIDGIWFQSFEKEYGMDAAMKNDIEVWRKFTVVEAKKIKKFLNLEERPGLEGLAKALKLRFYSNLNVDTIEIVGNKLWYTMVDCRVQTARKRKGMEYHPCKALGIVEYGYFAKTIDERISMRCISCFPEITDDSYCCRWEFTLEEE